MAAVCTSGGPSAGSSSATLPAAPTRTTGCSTAASRPSRSTLRRRRAAVLRRRLWQRSRWVTLYDDELQCLEAWPSGGGHPATDLLHTAGPDLDQLTPESPTVVGLDTEPLSAAATSEGAPTLQTVAALSTESSFLASSTTAGPATSALPLGDVAPTCSVASLHCQTDRVVVLSQAELEEMTRWNARLVAQRNEAVTKLAGYL